MSFLLGSLSGYAQSNILTERYDTLRTGATLGETSLNVSNVNSSQFGLLYSYPANGAVYSQPLYVKNLSIPGQGTHNVLIFGTMNDQLYAYDANSTSGTPLWTRDFTNPSAGITAVPIVNIVNSNSLNIVGNVGIESTPVISLATNTMYLVVRTLENGAYLQRLHAVDITTGLDKPGSPVVIQGSVPGTASDSSNGVLKFNPKMQNQRAALELVNGVVLIAWGSHEDYQPYHGWIMGYNATTLAQVGVFCTTPNGGEGGIWQAGRGPVVDSANNVYYETGNGDWDGVNEFSDSLLKFSVSPTSGLTLVDWFTPADQATLAANDEDMGSTGPLLVPNSNLLVAGDKQGYLFLFNNGNLGHETTNDAGALQELAVNGGRIKSGTVYWNSPQGPLIFLQADSDVLRSFTLNTTSTPSLTLNNVAGFTSPGAPGGVISLSANGSAAGTGIVWALNATSQSDNHGLAAGILRAYNAQTLAELWDSEMVSTRDRLGTLVKYVVPLVISGQVYAATVDHGVQVYGLHPPDFSVSVNGTQTATQGATANYTVGVTPSNGFSSSVVLSVSGLPSGASATFTPASLNSGSSTLSVATASSTPAGTYTLTITGAAGSLMHTATTQLTVTTSSGGGGGGGTSPAAISIDFVGTDTPMASTETAGVVSKANWNELASAAGSTPVALVNENGVGSGATVTWKADDNWMLPITDSPGNIRMMKGYLDAGAHPTTVTVTNLPASATGYDVYVYTKGDNGTATRTASYQITGSGISLPAVSVTDNANSTFTGTFTQANNSTGNYVKFSAVTATTFTLTATPLTSSNTTKRAALNGIQIIPSAGGGTADFSLGVSGTQTVTQGATANYTVSVTPSNGFGSSVALSVSGLPSGATASFTPASLNSGNSTLSVATGSSTPAGSYTLTVTGTSGSLVHTATTQLTVTSSSGGGGTTPAAISIDFVGTDTPMAATETAGVVSKANWNELAAAAGSTPVALVDANGVGTGATITWKADNNWMLPVTDSPGNIRMMKGYLDSSTHPTTVTVTNLPVSATGYDVYIYTKGDNGTATRTASYQITGSGISIPAVSVTDKANTTFTGTFTQANNSAGNYVKFSAVTATTFTLTATPGTSSNTIKRAALNGLQIVPH